jgi:hypothetical protein
MIISGANARRAPFNSRGEDRIRKTTTPTSSRRTGRRCGGCWVTFVTTPRRRGRAINDLYGEELRLFENLFLPSVKLARKERIGSRLRRRYEAPQTPFQRVASSPAADPERLTELRHLRETLDPFELSQVIQSKLERIFQLSPNKVQSNGQPATSKPERNRVRGRKDHSDARARAKTARGEKGKNKRTTKPKKGPKPRRRVTFLHCKTIRQKLHS